MGACAIVLVPTLALGEGGALAGLLTLTWTGGTVLIRRRWYAVYGVIVAGATPAMLVWPAVEVLIATTAVTLAAVAVALRPGAPGDAAAPGRWTRASASAVIGAGPRPAAGLGLERDVDRRAALPALALLPSTIAGLWAGHSLWRLEQLIPRVVTGVAVGESIAHGLRHGPLAGLLGAIARLLLLTAALSAALLLTPWLDSRAGVLLAFGLLALATLLASLLEALGRAHWAVAGVVRGVTAELAGAAGVSRSTAHPRGGGDRARAARCRRSRCWHGPPGRWRRRCGSHESLGADHGRDGQHARADGRRLEPHAAA